MHRKTDQRSPLWQLDNYLHIWPEHENLVAKQLKGTLTIMQPLGIIICQTTRSILGNNSRKHSYALTSIMSSQRPTFLTYKQPSRDAEK